MSGPGAPTRLLPILALVAACTADPTATSSVELARSPVTASLDLSQASASVSVDNTAVWSLTKTGSVSGNTVRWNITATKTGTASGHLLITGEVRITNGGAGPATIGNIVVNLQTRVSNKWKSASVDIADATQGDAATTAKIHAPASSEGKSSFTENAASGTLEFKDATNNTVFSLVPELTIPAQQTKSLRFEARFDNNVLHLAPYTPIRSEVIVSFGNARANNSTSNLDINGNGTVDPDEHYVRSVPARIGLSVPQGVHGNTAPTLSDTPADIQATGDVTFSHVAINLGATTGTVTATVTGGASGGTITNCAYLTSPDVIVSTSGSSFTTIPGVTLEACDTQPVGGTPVCTPGAVGCGWTNNDFKTFTQGTWSSTGASVLINNYDNVYAGSFGVLTIGTMSGHTASFTSSTNVAAFLPQSGTPDVLNANLTDPTTTSAGTFAGEIVALTLNVVFSDTGVTPKVGTTPWGDVHVCGTGTSLDGQTIRQSLTTANMLISVGPVSSIMEIIGVLNEIDAAFENGTVTSWAQAHLVNGTCP